MKTIDEYLATFKQRRDELANDARRAMGVRERPCKSGAHFKGNCRCIGQAGLDQVRADREAGVERPWVEYYLKFG